MNSPKCARQNVKVSILNFNMKIENQIKYCCICSNISTFNMLSMSRKNEIGIEKAACRIKHFHLLYSNSSALFHIYRRKWCTIAIFMKLLMLSTAVTGRPINKRGNRIHKHIDNHKQFLYFAMFLSLSLFLSVCVLDDYKSNIRCFDPKSRIYCMRSN